MENKSTIEATQPAIELKSKQQLIRLAQSFLPNRRFRVMTKETDVRSQGHKVALLEEVGTDGKLVFVVGAPTLSLAGSFLKAQVENGTTK